MLNILKNSILISLLFPAISMADSIIESRDGDGTTSRIYVQGNKARIDTDGGGYVVIDTSKQTMKVVVHEQQAIMDMSDFFKKGSSSATSNTRHVESYLKSKGLGPRIVGYETEEQEIYANGNYCGSVYVSVNALNDTGLRKFARAFEAMASQIEQNMSGMMGANMNQFIEDCELAEKNTSRQLMDLGFPLKSVDKRKRLENIVTRIDRNARIPANTFDIPQHYKVTNPHKMIQETMQQMQPQMQQMMQNMTPEMQEMMRQQMQNMRQQMQQHQR